MIKPVKLTVFCAMVLGALPAAAQESGLLELGAKPTKNTIVPIGRAPAKKKIPLELGALRVEEAKLPPAPLSRSERMALRAKRAMSRQREVSNASRKRLARHTPPPPPKDVEYDLDEQMPLGSDGEPVLE